MNKFIGVGRIVKEPELKSTNSGKSYMQNTIAIRNDYKSINGEYESEFINIVLWNKTAEYLSNYGYKGCLIAIDGRLTTRSYDKEDGSKGYITEVVVDKVELLSRFDKDTEDNEITENENTNDVEQEDSVSTEYNNLNDGSVSLSDDDLPF